MTTYFKQKIRQMTLHLLLVTGVRPSQIIQEIGSIGRSHCGLFAQAEVGEVRPSSAGGRVEVPGTYGIDRRRSGVVGRSRGERRGGWRGGEWRCRGGDIGRRWRHDFGVRDGREQQVGVDFGLFHFDSIHSQLIFEFLKETCSETKTKRKTVTATT